MDYKNKKYLIALSYFLKITPEKRKKLFDYFKNGQKIFKASEKELLKAGLGPKVANNFILFRKNLNINQIIRNLKKEKIKTICINEEEYPSNLKQIYDPPLTLFYQGKLKKQEKLLAVVGSRKNTIYGKQIINDLIAKLPNEISVVSGLALGIDSLSHSVCLENKNRTIAVLGSGINKTSIYPNANRFLAEKIVKNNGLLLSEFPPYTPPLKHHFPLRNRIISGLSSATLIIEAGEKSGSLITAQCALDQGREVFAVPGNIYSKNSLGTNKLIKSGANPVLKIDDILNFFGSKKKKNKKIAISNKEYVIIKIISQKTTHINEIAQKSGLDISTINSMLIIMEMKGLIKNLGNMNYTLI